MAEGACCHLSLCVRLVPAFFHAPYTMLLPLPQHSFRNANVYCPGFLPLSPTASHTTLYTTSLPIRRELVFLIRPLSV